MTSLRSRLAATALALALTLTAGASAGEIVVVAAARSPVDMLTRAELTDIYLGRSIRLETGDLVVPIDQAQTSRAYDRFYRAYLGRTPAQVKAHWSRLVFTGRGRPPQSVRSSRSVADVVADNVNAIGYIERDLVDDRLRVVAIEP